MLSPRLLTLPAVAALCAACLGNVQAAANAPSIDTAKIEEITGLKGTFSEKEHVFKLSKPRTDVSVEIDGRQMSPFMGLGSWAAFMPTRGGQVMLMGDTVLFQDEVNPVMSAALESGLEVTALHNHFFFDHPKVFFMHISGMGDAAKLAAGVRKMYDTVAEIRAAHGTPEERFPHQIATTDSITAAPLEAVFGVKGQAGKGMFKVVIGRTARMDGVAIGNEMGVNTWAAFAGSDDEAVVDGDFAMHENELQAVLKAMRAAGINIVAIHQHMTGEQPRILFLHYWGKGKAADLAKGVQSAVTAQNRASGGHR